MNQRRLEEDDTGQQGGPGARFDGAGMGLGGPGQPYRITQPHVAEGLSDDMSASGQPEHDLHEELYDPDYCQWRSEQIRKFDEDYRHWRLERLQRFSEEFSLWRQERGAQHRPPQASSHESAEPGDKSPPSPQGTSSSLPSLVRDPLVPTLPASIRGIGGGKAK